MIDLPAENELLSKLERDGFAFVPAIGTKNLLGDLTADPDWPAFASSWNDLGEDTYLAAHGRHRRRRHAVFGVDTHGHLVRKPHQAHYQSVAYNPLHGGIERWFAPIRADIGNSSILRRLLESGIENFGQLKPGADMWRIEAHQFRIEACAEKPGLPTPEGVHRDGVDYVLVVLIARNNVARGTTTIHDLHGNLRGDFTLSSPLDSAWVVDARVLHGVTPIHPLNPLQPAWRDVLVITYRNRQDV